MKDVTLSTGQAVSIRSKDELTEGQSRRIEIARSRGGAVLQKLQKPVFLKDGQETFEPTDTKCFIDGAQKVAIPSADLDEVTDEEWDKINGFTDVLIKELTVTFEGKTLADPTELPKPVYDALSESVGIEYGSLDQTTDSPDDKIDPKVGAAE